VCGTILVTGGAGYIGSHICKALAEAGFVPLTVDNLSRGHAWAVKWGPLEVVDIADGEALDRVFRDYRPWAVMHAAGYIAVGESLREPGLYYRNNVLGLLTLLDRMRRHGVDRMVFTSTAAIYGDRVPTPVGEEDPQAPANPYGASKCAAERILQDYDKAYGLRAMSLRCFNVAGADPEGEVGEAHEPETHVIPLALRAATDGDEILAILGTDYATPDGTAIRDFVHVSDVAAAHLKALDYLAAGGATKALNLGAGHGHSVRDIADAVGRVLGRPVKWRGKPRRPGDPAVLVADVRAARRILDWTPRMSDLQSIVVTAADWQFRQDARVRTAS
jgi:UDP-glucose-4-epimerase GalE